MKQRTATLAVVFVCGLAASAIGWQPSEGWVEPADLQRREDLIGREVVVDDRVAYYVPRNGSEDDELQLKRTPVTFQVPRRLRPSSTRMAGVVVHGVLKRDGGRLVCQVTSLQVVPNDLERLERGLASLAPKDYETRRAWARWAERRAADFPKDEAFQKRVKDLGAEVLRREGDLKRVAVDAPQEWLAMAQDARRRQIPEPEPSAQGHRALRAKLAAANGAAGVKAVVQEIESFFPAAAADLTSARANLAHWETPYANDPAGAYRTASPAIRKALDRRLWADAQERLLDLEASQDLASAIAVSEQAASRLPEKPNLPARLLEKLIRSAQQNLGALRLSEVKALAAAYRDKLRQPDEALKLLRDWLNSQRGRLSNTDAEGLVSLANLHDELLQDRVTAVELLRKAWKIDPASKEIAEAFRSRGFRKAKDEWVEVTSAAETGSAPDGPNSARVAPITTQSLLGLTAEEVRLRLNGEPKSVNYSGSKGQLIEQWIYLDNKLVRYVNLLHARGELKPRVIAYYVLPETSLKGGAGSAR